MNEEFFISALGFVGEVSLRVEDSLWLGTLEKLLPDTPMLFDDAHQGSAEAFDSRFGGRDRRLRRHAEKLGGGTLSTDKKHIPEACYVSE
ncbi:MAG: hypothetical protein AAF591_09300 [Verrucomicrobiota bacterium]